MWNLERVGLQMATNIYDAIFNGNMSFLTKIKFSIKIFSIMLMLNTRFFFPIDNDILLANVTSSF